MRYVRYSSFSSHEVVINVATNVGRVTPLCIHLHTYTRESPTSCDDEVFISVDLFSNVASHFSPQIFLVTVQFTELLHCFGCISQRPTLSFVLRPTILIIVLAVLLILCLNGFCTNEYLVSGNGIVPHLQYLGRYIVCGT